MKINLDDRRELLRDFEIRINPLDAKLAELEARVARNKAQLERTNERISAKLVELQKRFESRR
jgi:hypothetical protein